MLGRLHWFGGYDGRDIEFAVSCSGAPMNLIDFRCVAAAPNGDVFNDPCQDAMMVESGGGYSRTR